MARTYSSLLSTVHVPESRIALYGNYGYSVIARDSDHPLPLPHMLPPGQTYWPASAMLARRESPHADED